MTLSNLVKIRKILFQVSFNVVSYIFFVVVVVSDFPQERCPVVLAPLLYPEKRDILMDRILPDSGELAKTIMESSLAEFIQEVGYGFCARSVCLLCCICH